MHTSILGALFTFARRLWYPTYTSLEDQQLAGLILRWIREPRAVDPKTAMPDMGVTERDGRDIAAYLYTLR